ncbi:MAG: O-methyltransferase [Solirubrobacteraceae bacterium]
MRSESDGRLEDDSASSSLRGGPARSVLARLRSEGRSADEDAKRQVAVREAAAGGRRLSGAERAELCRDAPLAITDEVGELLYMFARARGTPRIVEFGSSLGLSTIHLAAAIRDGRGGSLIATEIDPPKATMLAANLAEAGLGDLVEVRVGDALQTLGELAAPIDLLVLDGWNELYLPVLHLVTPSLTLDALVIADLSADDPNLNP